MENRVYSDWLASYIKVTRTVLEIFKMAGYFTDGPRTMPFALYGTCRYIAVFKIAQQPPNRMHHASLWTLNNLFLKNTFQN
jgi:hypothetical protein